MEEIKFRATLRHVLWPSVWESVSLNVEGTGPKGRIHKNDVAGFNYVKKKNTCFSFSSSRCRRTTY